MMCVILFLPFLHILVDGYCESQTQDIAVASSISVRLAATNSQPMVVVVMWSRGSEINENVTQAQDD